MGYPVFRMKGGMKRTSALAVVLTGVGLYILSAAVLVGVPQVGSTQSAMPTPPAAADIGQLFPAGKVVIKPASFQPAVSEDEAIGIARDILRRSFRIASPESLPTSAMIALFTGEVQDGRRQVAEDVPVWIVVIEQVPTMSASIPQGSNVRSGPPQLNVAIDAQTGAVVHGVISGKLIKAAP